MKTTQTAILRRALDACKKLGFYVTEVHDGEEMQKVRSVVNAVDICQTVDVARVYLENHNDPAKVQTAWVLVVWQGCQADKLDADEALECLSDYTVNLHDAIGSLDAPASK